MAAREAALGIGVCLVEREARSREELLRALNAVEESDAYLSIPGGFPIAHMMRLPVLLTPNGFQPFSTRAYRVLWKL
jgi:hypothetical protein